MNETDYRTGAVNAARFFLAIVGISLAAVWAGWHVASDSLYDLYDVSADPNEALGNSMIKANMGGAVLVPAVFIGLYLRQGTQWLLPLIVAALALLVPRLWLLVTEGAAFLAIQGIVLEAIVIAVAAYLIRQESTVDADALR